MEAHSHIYAKSSVKWIRKMVLISTALSGLISEHVEAYYVTGSYTIPRGTNNMDSSITGFGGSAITVAGNQSAIETTNLGITYTNSIAVTPTCSLTLTGNITNSGTIEIVSGNLVLTHNNDYTGVITIDSGAELQFGTGGKDGSIASTSIINNGLVQFGTSDGTSCGANISGTGGVWKSISGTLTLSNSNSYTGNTNIAAGTLIGDISHSVGVAIASTCAYDLNGTARTVIDPSGSGTIQSSNANAALTITSTNGSTFAGTLASSLSSVTKNGSSTLTLSGTSAYAGPVTVSSGTLALANLTALGSSSAIALSVGATLSTNVAGTPTFANPITFGASATITVNQPTTFSGAITCTSSGGVLTINGGFPVTLSGAQSGTFSINTTGVGSGLNLSGSAGNAATLMFSNGGSLAATGVKRITNPIVFN